MAQLIKKIKITSTIELLTGLHIGGSKDNVEIGGIDLPVIKLATKENQPYIPGSSLKGKMRCLLEQAYGISKHGDIGTDGGAVRQLFGFTDGNRDAQPSRLIVRDAMLTPKSLDLLKEASDYLDMPFTENKFENSINRLTGTANKGIRQIERVPAGVEFQVEFVINVWGGSEEEKSLIQTFKEGIALLKRDFIGGSGSRGYGQIAFKDWNATQCGYIPSGKDSESAKPDWLKDVYYELGVI